MPNNVITAEVNGIAYAGFIEASITHSIENFARSFSLSIVQSDEFNLAIKLQDEIVIYIDDIKILTGYVEVLTKQGGADGISYSIEGRSKTGDLIDSSINRKTYKQKDFKKLVKNVLADNGFTNISVSSNLLFIKVDSNPIVDKNGETIFEFLDRIAKKTQVLLITNNKGNILITREGSTKLTGGLFLETASTRNNIYEYQLELTTHNRFNKIKITSQTTNEEDEPVSQIAIAYDNSIRSGRKLFIDDKKETKTSTLSKLANWHINIRRAKGSRYTCKVMGYYTQENELFEANKLIKLIDDYNLINGFFLIQSVNYNVNISRGCYTELNLVEVGTFSLDGVNSAFNLNNGSLGKNLIR